MPTLSVVFIVIPRQENDMVTDTEFTFSVTGCAAHTRVSPLLPLDWKDNTNDTSTSSSPSLLWENAPRHETKDIRDDVRCYSHLPNGTAVLDSKWALARLMRQAPNSVTTLETHCFRGRTGFDQFWKKQCCPTTSNRQYDPVHLPDLLDPESATLHIPPNNLWVVKDAMSNGAGGIWVVGEENQCRFSQRSPLIEEHKYIAQKYTWPMVLYGGRKCHVRVYGVMTSDGKAYIHDKCFLHVANEHFQTTTAALSDDSVHITNCCANSHEPDKFAGEIVASFCSTDTNHEDGVDLSKFYPSIAASFATFAERAFPFLRGGDRNGGFEYLGMDFILSEKDCEPNAYLLEVNAPPSQDTATGLPHAEELHNTVISDLIDLWILPRITMSSPKLGGWKCVFQDQHYCPWDIQPSKAVILNKIRWTLLERKRSKGELFTSQTVISFARSQFPYFPSEQIFFENAGGAQVPRSVTEQIVDSLKNRNRCVIGNRVKGEARTTLLTLLGTSNESHTVLLGSNATALLETLATKFVDQLHTDDEIVLASENHLANVTGWIWLAKQTGATIKWWPLGSAVEDVVTVHTRIVAISHASNILGQVRDIRAISKRIKAIAPTTQVVVDGVATAPHIYADLQNLDDVDWYVISCHKMFGPHLGALCGRHEAIEKVLGSAKDIYKRLEVGTLNYEACAGVVGLGTYFQRLGNFDASGASSISDESDSVLRQLSTEDVISAYQRIRMAEEMLVDCVQSNMKRNLHLRVIQDSSVSTRLPVFSFSHLTLEDSKIVASLREVGIQCRCGSFLSTDHLQRDFQFESVVRMSLAHYNTPSEINQVMSRFQQLQDNEQRL